MTVLADCCGCFANGGVCDGRVLVDEDLSDKDIAIGICEKCGAEHGTSATTLNPAVKRARLLQRATLPAKYADKHLDEVPDQAAALREINEWLAGVVVNERENKIDALPAPALHSEQGRGKTHVLTWLCKRLITERGVSVAFYSTRRLLRELQNFEHADERDTAWRRAITVQVLALDDLGAQQQTEWRHDQLADLVDERYERDLPILVATNFAPSMWPHMLDRRTASRLAEMTFSVELAGPDHRESAA